jgi:steroid 5-alpha reductase family enzyme
VDIGWSWLFIVPNILAALKANGTNIETWGMRPKIMVALIVLWGVRLSWHIGKRHSGVEDFRY